MWNPHWLVHYTSCVNIPIHISLDLIHFIFLVCTGLYGFFPCSCNAYVISCYSFIHLFIPFLLSVHTAYILHVNMLLLYQVCTFCNICTCIFYTAHVYCILLHCHIWHFQGQYKAHSIIILQIVLSWGYWLLLLIVVGCSMPCLVCHFVFATGLHGITIVTISF